MFAEKLVQVLQDRNITAYKLAKETGIHQSTISQWKSGLQKPSLEAAEKVADYLDCSVDYLLGRTDKPEINR